MDNDEKKLYMRIREAVRLCETVGVNAGLSKSVADIAIANVVSSIVNRHLQDKENNISMSL